MRTHKTVALFLCNRLSPTLAMEASMLEPAIWSHSLSSALLDGAAVALARMPPVAVLAPD
jgi:hypothetical protein